MMGGVGERGKAKRTCEDGRLEQLDEFVDLDEHVDCHFYVGASEGGLCQ